MAGWMYGRTGGWTLRLALLRVDVKNKKWQQLDKT